KEGECFSSGLYFSGDHTNSKTALSCLNDFANFPGCGLYPEGWSNGSGDWGDTRDRTWKPLRHRVGKQDCYSLRRHSAFSYCHGRAPSWKADLRYDWRQTRPDDAGSLPLL